MASINLIEIVPGTASNTDGTTFAGASHAPNNVTDPVYVGVAALRAAGQSVTPTLAGTNGWNTAWTAIATIRNAANTIVLTVFRGTPVSTVAGVLTATFTGETQDAGA